MRIFLSLFLIFFLVGCDETAEAPPVEEKEPELVLTEQSYADLPGWADEDFFGIGKAFGRSCHRILDNYADTKMGKMEDAGTYGDWQPACKIFTEADDWTPDNYREFFEAHFTPYLVSADNNAVGLFTGYYEASLKGSLTKTETYNIPLHTRPDDLVMVYLGQFREDLKGVRIAGRVKGGVLKPYETREQIIMDDWEHKDQVLLWVDDAVDAFFVQIQGSGIVQMNDGETMRIGYAGQNGHPYYAIGRELIKIGALTKENVSMQSIRAWLLDNPDRADEIMNTNKSYVFFRQIKGPGPLGAEGVALTAVRSLAVDRTKFSYGMPMWLEAEHPEAGQEPLRRLMVAQDTGGAINGHVRGDVFWGYGEFAEEMAGKMKSKGHYWVLLPKSGAPAGAE